MDDPRPQHEQQSDMTRRDQLRAQPRRRLPVAGHLCVASVDHCVPIVEFDRPEVAAVVVEDLCWRIALEDWQARRPPWWHRRARAAWRRVGESVQAERDRVALMARAAGIWT
jgi:hypothetical protein